MKNADFSITPSKKKLEPITINNNKIQNYGKRISNNGGILPPERTSSQSRRAAKEVAEWINEKLPESTDNKKQ